MLKKLFLSMFVGMMTLGVMAQEATFTLSGRIEGVGSKVMYYLIEPDGGVIAQETASVVGDRLELSFEVDSVGLLSVIGSRGYLFFVPVIPGEAVTVSGTPENFTFDGSPFYRQFSEVVAAVNPLQEACWKYDFKADCQDEIAGKTAEEIFDLYQAKTQAQYQPVRDFVLSYVERHPDSDASVFALRFLDDKASVDRAVGCLSKAVLEGRMKPFIEEKYEDILLNGCSFMNATAPDFTLQDAQGKPLPLSSLRGKWVLVDFWSTTCGASISQFMTLTQLYDQYKDHIEILGVDCETDETTWRTEMNSKFRFLPWKNVNGCYDFDDPENPARIYETTATPTYFLVNPSGKVVKKSVANAEEFKTIFGILFD